MHTGPERWLSGRARTALPEDSGGSRRFSLQLQGDLMPLAFASTCAHVCSLSQEHRAIQTMRFLGVLFGYFYLLDWLHTLGTAFFVNSVLNARTEECICSTVGLGIIPHTFYSSLTFFHIFILWMHSFFCHWITWNMKTCTGRLHAKFMVAVFPQGKMRRGGNFHVF